MSEKNETFLSYLRKSKIFIPEDEYDNLCQEYGEGTLPFLEALVKEGCISRDFAGKLWGDSLGVAYVDPFASIVTTEVVKMLPEQTAREFTAIGLYRINNVITMAMADPTDAEAIEALESASMSPISPVFAFPSLIKGAIDIHYTSGEGIAQTIQAFERTEQNLMDKLAETDPESMGNSPSLGKIVEALLFFAVKERAAVIHLEPLSDQTLVKFRIDGRLIHILNFSSIIHPGIVWRLKTLSQLNPRENRTPEKGRLPMDLGVKKMTMETSFIPAMYGVKVVLKTKPQNRQQSVQQLDRMFISQPILEPLRRVIQNPNGLILFCGPDGSEKSSTLYSIINEIHTGDQQIHTVEDPIEAPIEGVTQCQVNSNIDLGFKTLTKAAIEQDCDVLMLSRLKDRETAELAVDAALSGQLVISGINANSAIDGIMRLIEWGIDSHKISSAVTAVICQQMAARICEQCKRPYFPDHEVLSQFFLDFENEEAAFYEGTGCPHCRNTGFNGRIPFHELILISNEMRSLITQKAGFQELLAAAFKVGYRPMRYDGLKKVLLGLTTIEEVEAQTAADWEF